MIKTVGIIGAGLMGNGIAHVAALGGYRVLLTDSRAEAIENALKTIDTNMSRQVGRGTISESDKTAALARIGRVAGLADLGECDVVIEAATEKEQVKREIFKSLCQTLKKDALIASNTSSISITRLAASTDRPGKFMGMH
ncbi:MAG: 3-hydroxyacyl-CoA dehydrogenase NAD-binding domain-containing protein, partial [Alphaproteobacteria bacterium]